MAKTAANCSMRHACDVPYPPRNDESPARVHSGTRPVLVREGRISNDAGSCKSFLAFITEFEHAFSAAHKLRLFLPLLFHRCHPNLPSPLAFINLALPPPVITVAFRGLVVQAGHLEDQSKSPCLQLLAVPPSRVEG